MLFELEIEVYKSRIVVVSGDQFGPTIQTSLERQGADVYLVDNLHNTANKVLLRDVDAVVIADFASEAVFIGVGGHITAQELYELSPGVAVLQFVGQVCPADLAEVGIRVYPEYAIGPHRMASTFSDLGPRGVIELHTAGLKTGEVACRLRRAGLSVEEMIERAPAVSPAQILTAYI
jgi:hypothetical protein